MKAGTIKVEATNDFHNSYAVAYAKGGILNRRQVQRMRLSLCGSRGCTCSGETGIRGRQPESMRGYALQRLYHDGYPDGSYEVVAIEQLS